MFNENAGYNCYLVFKGLVISLFNSIPIYLEVLLNRLVSN